VQQRQSFNRREQRILARIVLAMFLLALLLLALLPNRSLYAYLRVREKISTVTADNERLHHETAQLRYEVQRLQEDLKYLEQIAREKYGMLKPNEEVYIINSPEPIDLPASEEPGGDIP
jgi:cell division protein FtsB